VRSYLPNVPIRIVEGEVTNIKITYPKDIEMLRSGV
jgi:2-C-methyl-D-erythritol 4-phosphate cytidylyltransferase